MSGEPAQPNIDVNCNGDPREMGYASGEISALELSSHHRYLRLPDADGTLSHSNAYRSPAIQRFEMPRAAVYSENAPQALRGTPIFRSAECRDERLSSLLSDTSILNSEDLVRILSDHGADDVPSADTICMHGDHWSTLASVQLYPRERKLSVAYGQACAARYTTFEV